MAEYMMLEKEMFISDQGIGLQQRTIFYSYFRRQYLPKIAEICGKLG